jgi:KDO2-lipid IV(A) lauroyltransferase
LESNLVGILILTLLRALAWSYFVQPRLLRRFWIQFLSGLLRLLKFRSEIIRQNLELAYPGEENFDQREELFRGAYDHLAALSLEILLLLGPMKKFVERSTRIEGVENWADAKKRGKGILFLSSHVGNWEVMAATGALLARIDVMLVTKHLKPEWLHQAIAEGRKQCGVSATYEPKTLRDVLTHLKANGTVGFVLDQYAGPPIGVRVPFFGIPVGTSTALATLAKRTGAAVLPVVNFRDSNGDIQCVHRGSGRLDCRRRFYRRTRREYRPICPYNGGPSKGTSP